MNRGISIVELAKQIEANRASKHDLIADTKQIVMLDDAVAGPRLHVEGQGAYNINQTAHRQIASRLKIPATYYDRMKAEAPELLVNNVNTWFQQNPERRMVRTMDGNARAFLSDRYQRIDNEEIAQVALPALFDIPDVEIVSSQITESRMYIQAVAPRIQGDVKVGDTVQAGVIVQNSEIGMGSVSVQAVAWRLICLNGMKVPDGRFRAYHVGRKIEDSAELWADDTKIADDRAVLLKVRDMVKQAVSEASFLVTLDKMRGTTEAKITGDPRSVVEVLAKKVGVNESEQGGILRALIEGGDLSAWGLINAVTAQAHDAQYDRAVEFEEAGGMLLNLPTTEWKRVLEAA